MSEPIAVYLSDQEREIVRSSMAVLFRIGGQIGTRKMNPRALKPEVWEMTAKIARLRASILRKIGAEQDALAWEQRAIDCEEVV